MSSPLPLAKAIKPHYRKQGFILRGIKWGWRLSPHRFCFLWKKKSRSAWDTVARVPVAVTLPSLLWSRRDSRCKLFSRAGTGDPGLEEANRVHSRGSRQDFVVAWDRSCGAFCGAREAKPSAGPLGRGPCDLGRGYQDAVVIPWALRGQPIAAFTLNFSLLAVEIFQDFRRSFLWCFLSFLL